MGRNADDTFSDEEARERFEKTLRGALKTPPKPLKDAPRKDGKAQPEVAGRTSTKGRCDG